MKKLKIPRMQSQRDDRWRNILLGYNTNPTFNIGNYGCLITCFANYLDKTPIEVNDILKANQGFVNGGELVWSKVSALGLQEVYCSPRYEDAVSSQGLSKMKSLIDEGRPLITEVDFNPSTVSEEMHFVLIHGYDETKEDTFLAIDPYSGTEIDLSVYGGVRRAVYRFRAYNKTLPFDVPQVLNDEYKKKIQEYFNYEISSDDVIKWCNDRKIEITTLQNTIGQKDQTINNLNQQINSLTTNLNQVLTEKEMLADQSKECYNSLQEKIEEYNKLNDEVSVLRSDKVQYEKMKADWQLKEIEYQKRIKTLETKLSGFKSPIKKLLVEIWDKIKNG